VTDDTETYGTIEWVLLSKASSASQGWLRYTKALPIINAGCLIQVGSQQRNPDGSLSLAEALTFVPDVEIRTDAAGSGLFAVDGRKNNDEDDDTGDDDDEDEEDNEDDEEDDEDDEEDDDEDDEEDEDDKG